LPDADDAGEIRQKARVALERAGDRAASLGAPAEATRYYEQAARLAATAAERAFVLDLAGRSAFAAAQPETAVRLLGEAIAVYEAEGDPHAAARLASRLAQIEGDLGRVDEATARMERALDVIQDDEPDEDLALLLARLAVVYHFTGRQEQALEKAERALDVAESLGAPEPLARALGVKAHILGTIGHPTEGAALRRQALAVALEHGLLDLASVQYSNLSDDAFRRDRYADAISYLEQALELTRRLGHRPGEWSILSELTYPLYMTGRWDEALAALPELTEEQLGSGALLLSLLTSVLEIHIRRGDLDGARRFHSLFDALAASADFQARAVHAGGTAALRHAEGRLHEALDSGAAALRFGEATAFDHQAVKQGLVEAVEAALALGEVGRAEELLSLVDGVPRGLRSPYVDAQVRRFRARISEDEGGLRGAASSFRELGVPFWLAVTLLELAELTGDSAQRDEARGIFEQLGATPWLARAGGARQAEPVG
jgi:tetratricopeptide (TPR) repeat protein